MKKLFVFFVIVLLFLLCNAYVSGKKDYERKVMEEDMKGIYISYLEFLRNFQGNSQEMNKAYIKKMLDNIKDLGFNTVFLQVSPFSDAIYNSKIFPYSSALTGVEGKNPGFDYLDYFLKEAHKRNLKLHAWINPYRISNTNDISKLSQDNPAHTFLATNDARASDMGIYYNPASARVIDLILKQVYEIISNYDVDGIHFDDYFYADQDIDKDNYLKYMESNPNITLSDFRLKMINTMIKSVYKLIKDYNPKILFSIAPDGNMENNYTYNFADVKTWLKDDGYVDIIMPELYYGFENEYKPFITTAEEWNNLIKNNVKMVPVLAFYKVGEFDKQAGSGQNEWLNNTDIIKRQINFLKTLNKYAGFSLFRYDYLFNEDLENSKTKSELNNLKDAF